jgi:hypothetical protein
MLKNKFFGKPIYDYRVLVYKFTAPDQW